MKPPIQLLLIEDNSHDAELIQAYLKKRATSKFDIVWKNSLQNALTFLENNHVKVILLDLFLSDSEGFATFHRVQEFTPEIPIVILSGVNDVNIAINAVSQGAQYYLVKGTEIKDVLEQVILYAIKRKKHEQESIEYAKAQERLAMFRRFVEDITHDIRTPFTTINNHIYILRMLLKDADPKVENSIQNIDKNVQRLHRIIEDMITLTTLEAEITVDNKDILTLELGEMIFQIVNSMEALAVEKNIALTYKKPLSDIRLWGSRRQLTMAVRHIITNSITYTPAGGTVTVDVDEHDSHISLSVSDTGIGIPSDDLPYIFDHFYRGDKARNSNDVGSGLGLSIAKRVVQLHNGTIQVESTLDEGSVFTINFHSLTSEQMKSLNLSEA